MNICYLYAYIWVTIFVCLSAGPVPQRNRRISYGLKLQNKPRRNAIKTTPTTTTTTSTTTTEALKLQNTSLQSIDDYLNYDYDYLHYFYDLSYDDATAMEGKNKQSNGDIRSEPQNFKNENPSEALSFKEENTNEAQSFKEEILQSEAQSFKEKITIEELSVNEKIPSEASSFKKEIPSEALNFKEKNPSEALSFKEKIPSEASSFKKEIPSEALSFKEKIPSEASSFKKEIPRDELSVNEKIPSEPASIMKEFSSQIKNARDKSFDNEPEPIKKEILNEPIKLSSSNVDQLKEIKVNRRNVTRNVVRKLAEIEEPLQKEEKSLSERKTLPEEAIHSSQERNSLLDEIKSFPESRKTLHRVVIAKIEKKDKMHTKKENPLIERQVELFETENIVPEEKIAAPEGEQKNPLPEGRKNLPEKNTFSLPESDASTFGLGILKEKVIESKAIKIEKEDKSTNKINIIIRKPDNSNIEAKQTELKDVKIHNITTTQGREGRLLEHDTQLQKINILPPKESISKNETVLEAVSNGIKQLRYTTQQPDVAKSAPKTNLLMKFGKQNNSSDPNSEELVKIVSEKTVSVDAPILGHNFMNNNSKLGWRSESSVSFEVSVESSRARGKEISSMPFHKQIVNGPERAQESMQLKEQLSLEVSATPKITDILPSFRPRITEAKQPKIALLTLEHTTENVVITIKPVLTEGTTENYVTRPEKKSTTTSVVESPSTKISQNGTDFSLAKNSSQNSRTPFNNFESAQTSNIQHITTSKPTSPSIPIPPTSTDNINNEDKSMKHSTPGQIATTNFLTVTQATTVSETSNIKTFFFTEEHTTTTTPRYNGLPKKRQSRPFRRNSSLNSRKLIAPNENLVPPHLIAQLGMNPHGIHPSGINPFGMQPQGITPFGISPKGIDPLGLISQILNATHDNITHVNHQNTTMTNETITELKVDPVAEERVHVQVTKPDGSINGDYLVLDHNTGSLSGVRYEAIDGADQALIQKALLSFLSLDPRLDPRPKDMNDESLPESVNKGGISPESPALVDAINTESTISVKLKPQLTDQT